MPIELLFECHLFKHLLISTVFDTTYSSELVYCVHHNFQMPKSYTEMGSSRSCPGLGFGRGSPMPRTKSDRDFSDPAVFGQKGSVLVLDPVQVRSLVCQLLVGWVCSYVLTRQMSGRTRD